MTLGVWDFFKDLGSCAATLANSGLFPDPGGPQRRLTFHECGVQSRQFVLAPFVVQQSFSQ